MQRYKNCLHLSEICKVLLINSLASRASLDASIRSIHGMSISSSPSLLITTMSIVLSQQACFPLPPPASLHKLIRWAWGCRESKVIELSVATVYPKFCKCWATLRVLTHVSNSLWKHIYPSSSISKWSLALHSIHPPDSLLAPTTLTIPN